MNNKYAFLFKEIEELLKNRSSFSNSDKESSQNKRIIIAIEGSSASGKTTLASFIEKTFNATVFHVDDFFLQPFQRTRKRYLEPGGNFDKERFIDEVLLPLYNDEVIQYRRFDCKTLEILPAIEISPAKLCVIEGAYSMHPDMQRFYDFSVFLEVSTEVQKERIKNRNSEAMQKRFFEEWIPMEQKYFKAFGIKEKCNLIINVD